MNTLIVPGSGQISFSQFLVGSSELPPLSSSARIAYTPGGGLTIVSTASSIDRFNVEGVYGNLLTVNDTATGVLFKLSDMSGFPKFSVDDGGNTNTVGIISSQSVVYALSGNSTQWNSTYATVQTFSSTWGGGAAPVLSVSGSNIPLGDASDNSLSANSVYLNWVPSTKVTNALDDLNEVLENIRKGTFIKSVFFTPSQDAIGSGASITLSISLTGNQTGNGVLSQTNDYRYDIDWGDGDPITTFSSTAVPSNVTSTSHVYTLQGLITISLSAYNVSGGGTGSFASITRPGVLTVYTATPVAQFNLYRNESTGGTVLAGSNLWVKTSDTLYLENTSTNSTNVGANPVYTIQWNTGDNLTGITNSDPGGRLGSRASKSSYTSSSTSTFPVKLTITSHSTCNPADIPAVSNTSNLKVYSLSPTLPTALNARSIVFSTSTQKLLAANFTDNSGGASTTAGNNIQRYTTGTAETNFTTAGSNISYVANSSIVTALVNGSDNGNRTIDYSLPSNNNNTFTSLVLQNFTDYGGATNYDSSGAATTFAASIYFPTGFYGTQAKISKLLTGISTGVNSYQLNYNNGSSNLTNKLEFVKDDLTSSPTINVGSSTISQNTQGTLRYISGVPYYNAGGIVNVAGVTFSNWIGQTYETGTPVTFTSDTAIEGSGSLFSGSQQTKTYANLDGSTTYLQGGIPKATTGQSSPYAIGTQTLNINATSTAIAARVKLSLINVNGTTNSSAITDKIIQLYSATPTFNEEAITCTVAGNSTAAKRINTSWTGGTPVYNSATNYFASNVWSGAITVAGTDEAIVRFNQLKHYTTDLSTGYLPTGPNLSTGRSGTQYFRFAFTRPAAQNFTFAITAPNGIAGLWIAAPGTVIDTSSTLNGWIDGSINYAGTGAPGAGTGGNGSNGCATGANGPIPLNTNLTAGTPYTLTLGTVNLSNATNNQLLVTVALDSSDYITSLSIS
jgi:hypothetical protein